MACYRPLNGYRSATLTKNGKRGLVFNVQSGYADLPVTVPCGQCIGCRLARSQQWAARCLHESRLHLANCFITLTYSPENLPPGGSLVKKHFSDFMKRMRKRFGKMRYFHCGEYGDQLDRPHYHALLFGFDFPDKRFHKNNPQGDPLFSSETLDKIWGLGHCLIGPVTASTAAYVARYVIKKQTGDGAKEYYSRVDPATGEVHYLVPPYITMSLKPGIGGETYEKFSEDYHQNDFVIVEGRKQKLPRYYDKQLEKVAESAAQRVKRRRQREARKRASDNTPERLAVREDVAKAKLSLLKRNLET